MNDKTPQDLTPYIIFCKDNVNKLPRTEKILIGLAILDADIKKEELDASIPDLNNKTPNSDGLRIIMNKLPSFVIMDIYKKISTFLNYKVVL
jgi:hypothetical protein